MQAISLDKLVRLVLHEYKLQEESSKHPKLDSTALEIRELVRQYREREDELEDGQTTDNL